MDVCECRLENGGRLDELGDLIKSFSQMAHISPFVWVSRTLCSCHNHPSPPPLFSLPFLYLCASVFLTICVCVCVSACLSICLSVSLALSLSHEGFLFPPLLLALPLRFPLSVNPIVSPCLPTPLIKHRFSHHYLDEHKHT